MQENDHRTRDHGAGLYARCGAKGATGRTELDREAYAFCTGQMLRDARRESGVTQSELARRTGTTKSYVSRVENGIITPSVCMFYRMVNALGFRIDIVRPSSRT